VDNLKVIIMQTQLSGTLPKPQTQVLNASQLVRIAYFIMIHHKPEVFKKMFQKIYTKDQVYLIHIDRKAKPKVTEEIQLYLVNFPNVYILEGINIVSGGFSMIQAEMNGMEFLLSVGQGWDYFINLSGEDLPLKSQNIIRQFLTANNGRNYLFYYDQKFYRPDTLQRIQNHFTELSHKISSYIYKREFMENVIPYIGGKWFILTRDTCSFLINNKMVMDFEDYYLHTFLPAESFFQTVLMNTSFNEVIVNDDKRAVIDKPFFNSDQYSENLISLLKSGNHLFIRKVSEKTDPVILEYIHDSYNMPLQIINEVERELKRDQRQDN
jgi:hypothetical protein